MSTSSCDVLAAPSTKRLRSRCAWSKGTRRRTFRLSLVALLWWRFCERKRDIYICQQEGIVYADALDPESIDLVHRYAKAQGRKAEVEDGCPEDILVQSRTEFVDGEFWTAVQAGAVIVCFNAPFDLSRLALEYREARKKNSGWSMVVWKYEGNADKLKPKLRIKPKDSRSAFISFAGGDLTHLAPIVV